MSETNEVKALANVGQSAVPTEWNPSQDQISLLKRTICKDSDDDEFALFVSICKKMRLDPFARQIHAVKRWDSSQQREVMSIQVSIDGFRLIADRTGQYAGQLGPFWCGDDGVWKDAWLSSSPPAAAKVGILRHGFTEPMWGVARFDAYAQMTKQGQLNSMWRKLGDVMIAKVAEALGLRKAFPHELCGVYSTDEMLQASNPEVDAREVDEPKKLPPAVKNTKSKTEKAAKDVTHPETEPTVESESYRVPFGKFKGQVLEKIDVKELINYVDYLTATAAQANKPMRDEVKDFINRAESLIGSLNKSGPPSVNSEESIPW